MNFSASISRILYMLSKIQSREMPLVVVSFVLAFILMAAYFTLRPVRDAMASDWSDTEVSMLWNIQFFVSLTLVSLYGLFVSRVSLRWVAPAIYGLFSLSFILFFFVNPSFSNPVVLEKVFYVWVSAFSLFHLSIFWSLMASTYSAEQGRRLFAIIASGASAGAIFGPVIPVVFARHVGLEVLMLVAGATLMLSVPLTFLVTRFRSLDNETRSYESSTLERGELTSAWWSGFKDVIFNPYLLGIAIFILLAVFINSFVYFGQKNLLSAFTRPERAQILGSIDWLVNTLTFIIAFFITSRLLTRCGMPFTLASVPLLLVLGMLVLAFSPVIIVLLAIQVARRVGSYSITRPAREVLFTRVNQHQRFKAKAVIDVVVYRGGDAVSGTLFALLSDGLGLALSAISLLGAAVAAVWAALARRLGLRFDARSRNGEDKARETYCGDAKVGV